MRAAIDDAAAAALMALPFSKRRYDPHAYLIRQGEADLDRCSFVLHGFACRQKVTVDGARQIVSLHIPGDFLDLQQLFLRRSDHNVQAITSLETIDFNRRELSDLAIAQPTVGRALWTDTLAEASIYREWLTNIGRRGAGVRIAHMLCELAVRLKAIGLGDGESCVLPMTQEQLGDATGLTSIHVNRVLKQLADDGVIQRSGRAISFRNWELVKSFADFSTLYLHLDQAA